MIEYLPLVLTGIGIIVSILYYSSVLRNANKTQQMQLETRQAQLFMQIYDKWTDPAFNEMVNEVIHTEYNDYEEWYENTNNWSKNSETTGKNRAVGQYFEGIGVLVKRGLIDVHLVDDMMSGFVLSFWNAKAPYIKEFRKRMNAPAVLEWAEYLCEEVKKVAEEQHPGRTQKYN
jgi:hypothetical protein